MEGVLYCRLQSLTFEVELVREKSVVMNPGFTVPDENRLSVVYGRSIFQSSYSGWHRCNQTK
jgi:hypothetical protein